VCVCVCVCMCVDEFCLLPAAEAHIATHALTLSYFLVLTRVWQVLAHTPLLRTVFNEEESRLVGCTDLVGAEMFFSF
jgi:hypothetical protein